MGGKVKGEKKEKNEKKDSRERREKNEKKETKRKTAKFGKLLDGVVFTISGFQNPLRGEIRGKALEMGARYRGDWDKDCTHLICAFTNTPKFNQVKGSGKIVTKNWIEECHRKKVRFPWRKFCLDKADRGDESEEEVWDESLVKDKERGVEGRRRRKDLFIS